MLGSTADPREFFLTMDCEDIALSTVSKVSSIHNAEVLLFGQPDPPGVACSSIVCTRGAASATAAGGGRGGVEEEGRHRGGHRRPQGRWPRSACEHYYLTCHDLDLQEGGQDGWWRQLYSAEHGRWVDDSSHYWPRQLAAAT